MPSGSSPPPPRPAWPSTCSGSFSCPRWPSWGWQPSTGCCSQDSAARPFQATGFEVTQLVRELRPQPASGARRVRLDLDDVTTFAPALAWIEVLGLATPSVPGQVERELALIDAAARAGTVRTSHVRSARTGGHISHYLADMARPTVAGGSVALEWAATDRTSFASYLCLAALRIPHTAVMHSQAGDVTTRWRGGAGRAGWRVRPGPGAGGCRGCAC